MPLQIINYNIDYKEDSETLEEIEKIINVIKENINGKYYKPYKNLLKKMNKFIDMMINNFETEFNEVKKQIEEDEKCENDYEDTISISSISDYEQDETDERDNIQIEQFEKLLESKLRLIKNRFEFEFSKIYDINY
jgi:cell division protein YceG involved in septum cleavage